MGKVSLSSFQNFIFDELGPQAFHDYTTQDVATAFAKEAGLEYVFIAHDEESHRRCHKGHFHFCEVCDDPLQLPADAWDKEQFEVIEWRDRKWLVLANVDTIYCASNELLLVSASNVDFGP
jgi:hypothetical protein